MKIRRFNSQFKASEYLFRAAKYGRQGTVKKDSDGKYEVKIFARGQR